MLKYGGAVVGSGSDGCVFNGTFDEAGTFTESPSIVTKVYAGTNAEDMAKEEYAMMVSLGGGPLAGGALPPIGMLLGTTPPRSIAAIPDAAWSEAERTNARGACGKIIAASPAGPFYGLELPRVGGTMSQLRGTPFGQLNFADIEMAITELGVLRICHMDLAVRNVFYVKKDATFNLMLGDFGTSVNFGLSSAAGGAPGETSFEKSILGYVVKYRLPGVFLACIKSDGMLPAAIGLMIVYQALESKEIFERLVGKIREENLDRKTKSMATKSWICETLTAKAGQRPTAEVTAAIDSFKTRLALQYSQIISLFAGPDKTFEGVMAIRPAILSKIRALLSKSDKCMLEAMKVVSMDTLEPAAIAPLEMLWFGARPATRGGAIATETTQLDFDTPEGAYERHIPALEVDKEAIPPVAIRDPSEILGPKATLGGKRKTRRKRARRVKMSRKPLLRSTLR